MDVGHVTWRKSSYSGNNGGGCVEVARGHAAAVAVRDSKDPDGPKLAFTPADWRQFIHLIKSALAQEIA
jgi:Domain of unknown function (DUF397)